MKYNFYDSAIRVVLTSPSRDFNVVYNNVESIEEKTSSELFKEGYDVDRGRYIVIHLNAEEDYAIATFKITKDLTINIF